MPEPANVRLPLLEMTPAKIVFAVVLSVRVVPDARTTLAPPKVAADKDPDGGVIIDIEVALLPRVTAELLPKAPVVPDWAMPVATVPPPMVVAPV